MVFSVATGPEPYESQTCMDRLISHSVYCVSWFVLQTELGNVSFVSLELKACSSSSSSVVQGPIRTREEK